jgi:hypothetical protein
MFTLVPRALMSGVKRLWYIRLADHIEVTKRTEPLVYDAV